MEEGLAAELAAVGVVMVAVETAMQLQVDVLGELGVAYLALVRFFSRVQTLVRLQIAGAAKAFVTNLKGIKKKKKVHTYGYMEQNGWRIHCVILTSSC